MKTTSNFLKYMAVVFLVFSISLWVDTGYGDSGKMNKSTYYYNPSEKLDPFKPFIDTTKTDQQPEKSAPKSQLQKISIDELKLVGIAWSGKKRVALVEDSKGKHHHYVLHKGTPVGMNEGRVVKILADQVIIMERIKSPSGKVKTNSVILKLRTGESGGIP